MMIGVALAPELEPIDIPAKQTDLDLNHALGRALEAGTMSLQPLLSRLEPDVISRRIDHRPNLGINVRFPQACELANLVGGGRGQWL